MAGDGTSLLGSAAEGAEEVIRPLGTYERFRVVLHDLGFHYNVSVTGLYAVARASAVDHRSLFLSAIRKAVLRHPNLWLQVRHDEDGTPYFIRLAAIDVEHVVSFSANDSATNLDFLNQVLSHENSTGFVDAHSPLWRIRIIDLRKSDLGSKGHQFGLIFVYHHVIADGKSGLAMHNSILEYLNQLNGETEGPYLVHAEPGPLLPGMDELIGYTTSWKSFLLSACGRFLPCFRKDFGLKKWSGAPYHSESSRTKIRLLELSADETKTIQRRCREQQASVTSFFQVLVGSILFARFKSAESLRCATAISLRRFLPRSSGIDDSEIGLWIDGFADTFTRCELLPESSGCPRGVSWNAARQSKRHIENEISKGLTDLGFAWLQGVSDFRSMLLSHLGNVRTNSYSIISLGVFEDSFPSPLPPSERRWTLPRLYLSQSAHVNGSAIQFCLVSTDLGGMGISLNWQEGTVCEGDIEVVVTCLREVLARIGQP